MKRGHTVLEYKQKLRKLRAVRPDICISTDLIIGFPGETDDDFMATMNLVAEVGFDQSFSFIYSRGPARRLRRCRMKYRMRSSSGGSNCCSSD